MMDDLIGTFGTYGNNLIVAVVGVGVSLLLLVLVLWLIRRRSGASPFIRGGRNRQPRLQILDATAVDARRRLVLLRRDNVEHLVMIGGPTDIVIESGIGAIPVLTDVSEREPDMKAISIEREREEPKAPQQVAAERRASLPTPPVSPTVATAPPVRVPVAPPVSEPSAPPVEKTPVADRSASTVAPVQAAASVTAPPIAPAPQPSPIVQSQPAAVVQTAPVAPTPPRPAAPPITVDPAPIAPIAAQPSATRIEPPAPYTEHTIQTFDASNILDAARERVMPHHAQSSSASIPKPTPTTVAAHDVSDARLNSDVSSEFERILEHEMAKSRATAEAGATLPNVQPATPQRPQPPRQEPSAPPISGASPDGDVQKEMARIFGEMSVTRDR